MPGLAIAAPLHRHAQLGGAGFHYPGKIGEGLPVVPRDRAPHQRRQGDGVAEAIGLRKVVAVHRLAGALRDVLALLRQRPDALHHGEIHGRTLNRQFDDFDKGGVDVDQARKAALR
ncbi:hypothetical protein G6F58_013547 [Rhizopus delemar]|nr:hypothetical protein G6F58_013547 [Rhizopus delemar]